LGLGVSLVSFTVIFLLKGKQGAGENPDFCFLILFLLSYQFDVFCSISTTVLGPRKGDKVYVYVFSERFVFFICFREIISLLFSALCLELKKEAIIIGINWFPKTDILSSI